MTPSEAAQQVAALLNELKRQGVRASMGDWPECHIAMSSEIGGETIWYEVVWRGDGDGWEAVDL